MKRIIIYMFLLFVIAFQLMSCYKDVILPDVAVDPDGPPQPVSFSAELKPMFTSQCALSGCHSVGNHKPYLTQDIAWAEIVNGGFVNTLVPKQSTLYIMINGPMKEYIPNASDRQKVYDWIRNGAPNN
ncbi:MAG: hypothetical protein EOO01_00360 [Chitinophagaceae bacterium]|nr:MAG: hypothetical protein EOO01_00360 [Chitinophagaceae bacterium]